MKMVYKIFIIAVAMIFIGNIGNIVYARHTEDASNQKKADYSHTDEAMKQKKEEQEVRKAKDKTEKLSDILEQADNFLKTGRENNDSEDSEIRNELRVSLAQIFNVLSIIGMILSVVVGGIIGIKFMIASAEEKANMKETMIPYVIGCIVIFSAFGIWKMVASALSDIF